MIRAILAASALLLAIPVAAQSQQDRLDDRYDRALAAGYKALMLCGAIANAEANGVTRTPESVAQWELTGIQAPLDAIVGELEHRIYRAQGGSGVLSRVEVDWALDMPARMAWHASKVGGCTLGPIGATEAPPRDQLQRSHPDAIVNDHVRILPKGISSVFSSAFGEAYGKGSRTTAVIVSGKQGDGLWRYHEDFGPATPQRTWSVAKSMAATIIGAALLTSKADVMTSAGLGESDADPRRAITIDHLLRMASGRYSDTPGNRSDMVYFGGTTVRERTQGWPLLNPPGTMFRYANNDTLSAVAAVKDSFADHPPRALLDRIGMGNTYPETDWQGNFILSSQVWATAPDLMRLGQLYLNDGKLPDGTRILPEGWVRYVSTPSGPQPDGPFGYGAGFWLMNKSDGVPPDSFAAFGNRGQYVVIVPSRDVVIVRRGEDPVGARFDIAAFTRDVLAALPRQEDKSVQ